MIRIGDFSRLTKVSIKTLRYYDKLGLLVPAHVDDATGYRYYSVDQITRINRILALKEMGLSLVEIATAVNTHLTPEEMINLLKGKMRSSHEMIELEQTRILRIRAYIKIFGEEDTPMQDQVVLKETPALQVASLRDTITNYQAQGSLWAELIQYLQSSNIKVLAPCIAIYHDMEYKDKDVDIEVVAAVPKSGAGTSRIRFKELPAARNAACLIHRGSNDELVSSYHAISRWVAENHYEISDPGRECHLKGPWNEPNPDEWVTEIQLPVRKKGL